MARLTFIPISSGGGSSTPQIFSFNNASSSPLALRSLVAGQAVFEIVVKIEVAFAGTFSLTIGTPASPSLFVASTDVDLTTTNQYKFYPYYVASGAVDVNAYLSGVSGTGSGYIFISN